MQTAGFKRGQETRPIAYATICIVAGPLRKVNRHLRFLSASSLRNNV